MDHDLKILNGKLLAIKDLYEKAIISGGTVAVHSLIRSQRLIGIIHDYIKEELISFGISPDKITPKLNKSSPELRMAGFLKRKKQDISVLGEIPKNEKIKEGVLLDENDEVSKDTLNKSLSINVRSQLSSIGKNFDTLYERTFAEALNLHLRVPELVMGEVYMLSLIGYDPDKMLKNQVGWKEKFPIKYIPAFRALNNRNSVSSDGYKYERVCLLIVDFSKEQPKIIESSEELYKLGWIKKEEITLFSLEGLGIKDFIKDLLKEYEKRHGSLSNIKV